MDEKIVTVEDTLTRGGWRRVHFMSGVKAAFDAEVERRMAGIPWESAPQTVRQRYQEAGVWHCVLLWPLRGEPVVIDPHPNPPPESRGGNGAGSYPVDGRIILWVLTGAKDERVSEAVEMATWRHMAWVGKWPDAAWVGKRFERYVGRVVQVEPGREVPLVAGFWLPELGIGLGRKVDDG